MVQLTTHSKKLLVRMFEKMPENEKARFGRDLKISWDKIITSDVEREFKITPRDIFNIVCTGQYAVPSSLFNFSS